MTREVRERIVQELRCIERTADTAQRAANRSAVSWLVLAAAGLFASRWLGGVLEIVALSVVIGCVVMVVCLALAGALCLYNRYMARRTLREMGEGL
jgi:hypothetical protein